MESFNLTVNPPSFVFLGNPHQATIIIIDDDGKQIIIISVTIVAINMFYTLVVVINFNQSTYIVNENDGLAQPELILSNPSVFDITLQIRDINIGLSGINAHM